jgi:hypothetical protein
MENRTFAQFDLFIIQHIIKSMIFKTDIGTLAPYCYFHHQTTHHHHHHHHRLMISIQCQEKKLVHNFEVFSFKA